MQVPIVNHPDYVAKINEDNKFPIKKFGALAEHLLKFGIVKKFSYTKGMFDETMLSSHSLKYINDIRNKTLDIKAQKELVFQLMIVWLEDHSLQQVALFLRVNWL